MHFLLRLAVLTGLLGTPAVAVPVAQPSMNSTALSQAPLIDPNGGRVTPDELNGRPLIVQFWSTRCPVCRVNDQRLRRWGYEYADRDVVVIGVLEHDTLQHLAAYERGRPIGETISVDTRGRLAQAYHVTRLPQTLFFRRNGQLVKVVQGRLTDAVILRWLRRIL